MPTSHEDVVVVAARDARPEYEHYHAYVCQPLRTFRDVQRVAFYSRGEIYDRIPRILAVYDPVRLELPLKRAPSWPQAPELETRLRTLLSQLLADNLAVDTPRRVPGTSYKVFLLSPPNSPETILLSKPIVNDLKSKSGKTAAFTRAQRYVSLERLRSATRTSELVRADSRPIQRGS